MLIVRYQSEKAKVKLLKRYVRKWLPN